jgi:electron transport complex protein RnfB
MTAVVTIGLLALVAGVALSYAYRSLPVQASGLIDQVNDLLPQTQCAQCGYPGCRPYAAAIVDENVPINLCPPGGDMTVRKLAELLGKDALPLAAPAAGPPGVAHIDEARCIGCGHCRTACPVDAIVGAPQLMYSIIDRECTGCELCIAPCPVDCISMESAR